MNIDGRVIALNRTSRVAAADVGLGRALVFEFQPGALIEHGDLIERLSAGYHRLYCNNVTQRLELNVLMLTEIIEMDLAKFIVGAKSTAVAQQIARSVA